MVERPRFHRSYISFYPFGLFSEQQMYDIICVLTAKWKWLLYGTWAWFHGVQLSWRLGGNQSIRHEEEYLWKHRGHGELSFDFRIDANTRGSHDTGAHAQSFWFYRKYPPDLEILKVFNLWQNMCYSALFLFPQTGCQCEDGDPARGDWKELSGPTHVYRTGRSPLHHGFRRFAALLVWFLVNQNIWSYVCFLKDCAHSCKTSGSNGNIRLFLTHWVLFFFLNINWLW